MTIGVVRDRDPGVHRRIGAGATARFAAGHLSGGDHSRDHRRLPVRLLRWPDSGSWRWMLGLACGPGAAGPAAAGVHARHRAVVSVQEPGRRCPPVAAADRTRTATSSRNSPRSPTPCAKNGADRSSRCCACRIFGPPLFVVGLGFFAELSGINGDHLLQPAVVPGHGFSGQLRAARAAGADPAGLAGRGADLAGARRPGRTAAHPVVRHRNDDPRRRGADRRVRGEVRCGLGLRIRRAVDVHHGLHLRASAPWSGSTPARVSRRTCARWAPARC